MSDDDRVHFAFDSARRGLTSEEAALLVDWLWLDRSVAAHDLAPRLEAELAKETPVPIDVDSNDLAALRDVLCGTDVGTYEGLALLKETVCEP